VNRTRRNKILYRFKRLREDTSGLVVYLNEIVNLSEGRPERLKLWADTAVGMIVLLARFFERMERLYRGEQDLPLPGPEDLLTSDGDDGA